MFLLFVRKFCYYYDNGIFRYYTVEDVILGETYTKRDQYDLSEVVILNLGDAEQESELEILNLLNVLFSQTVTPQDKKKRLEEEFHIAMTAEFEEEVKEMCNLGHGLVNQGMERGITQGEIKKAKKVACSLAGTGMAVEKIAEIVEVSVSLVREWLEEEHTVK